MRMRGRSREGAAPGTPGSSPAGRRGAHIWRRRTRLTRRPSRAARGGRPAVDRPRTTGRYATRRIRWQEPARVERRGSVEPAQLWSPGLHRDELMVGPRCPSRRRVAHQSRLSYPRAPRHSSRPSVGARCAVRPSHDPRDRRKPTSAFTVISLVAYRTGCLSPRKASMIRGGTAASHESTAGQDRPVSLKPPSRRLTPAQRAEAATRCGCRLSSSDG